MSSHPISNPSLDSDTLRERILTGGVGTTVTRGSLTKVATRYRDFVEAVWTCARLSREQNNCGAQSARTDEGNHAHLIDSAIEESRTRAANLSAALTRELLLYDLDIRKLVLSSRASDRNSSRSASTLAQMLETVSATQKEIETLTSTLERERKIKQHREEYNALAKIGNEKHPPMRKTRLELEKVEREMEKLKSEVKDAQWELCVRERQMRVLLQSVEDLKATLREEDIMREGSGAIVSKGHSTVTNMGGGSDKSSDDGLLSSRGKKRKRLDGGSDSSDDADVGAL